MRLHSETPATGFATRMDSGLTEGGMRFQWNPQFPPEWEAPKPPPVWFFLGLFVIVQLFALAVVVPGLPKSGALPWDRLLRYAVAVPFFCWPRLRSWPGNRSSSVRRGCCIR